MTTYIYGLVDPLTHHVSYIGRTVDLYDRFDDHLQDISENSKAKWLKRLCASGMKPLLVVLDVVSDEYALAKESWWIAFGQKVGWPLTNTITPRSHDGLIYDAIEELQERVEVVERENRIKRRRYRSIAPHGTHGAIASTTNERLGPVFHTDDRTAYTEAQIAHIQALYGHLGSIKAVERNLYGQDGGYWFYRLQEVLA